MLTSREKPKEVAALEGGSLPVRSLQLRGLEASDAQEILRVKGYFRASESEWLELMRRYAGNPLALKIISTTIQELFDGNVADFLSQGTVILGDIRDLLDQQFDRLSDLEKELMYWLAINREPVTLFTLREDICSPVSSSKLLEALESLKRRSLLEKSANRFTLQPVVMEYVTAQFVEQIVEEVITYNLTLFISHALIKAQNPDYIIDIQIRLILKPVIESLLGLIGTQTNIENKLSYILSTLPGKSSTYTGYAAGNLINLLCQMQTDLTGFDFSQLTVWQACLQNVNLHQVNFAHSDLSKSVFAETLSNIFALAFSPDGKLLAVGEGTNEIHVWQVEDGKQVLSCQGHTAWIQSVAFSPDGQLLASGSHDHTIRLWDVATGECVRTLQGHTNWVNAVAFAAKQNVDGWESYTLASGGIDQTVKLWNTHTGSCVRTIQGRTSWIPSVDFSPNGQMQTSGGYDRMVRLWDTHTGQCLKALQGHTHGILSVLRSLHHTCTQVGVGDVTKFKL